MDESHDDQARDRSDGDESALSELAVALKEGGLPAGRELAALLVREGRYAAAEQVYRRLIELERDTTTLSRLAWLLDEVFGRREEAKAIFEGLASRGDVDAIVNLGNLYEAEGTRRRLRSSSVGRSTWATGRPDGIWGTWWRRPDAMPRPPPHTWMRSLRARHCAPRARDAPARAE